MAADDASEDALAATNLAATRNSAAQLQGAQLVAGTTLGRYVVEDVLGIGGMGIVYRARDPQLGRLVALKVVRPSGDSAPQSEYRSRLVREAQAMARVAHPNVIVVHDAGSVDEQMFIAMELVDGTNLDAWEHAAPRTWREILDVYVQAGRGLAAAHDAGLVHRDFKPANTLVAHDGRVRVLDFGLARTVDEVAAALDAPTGDRTGPPLVLTMTGAVMGTPQFMSPEQHRGERADARSDQFSFCVALFRSLYGRYPFEGTALGALALAVTKGPAPELPKGTAVPAAIGRAILRGLSRDPHERYASMTALVHALQPAVPKRQRRFAVAAIVALAVAGVTVVLMVNRGSRHASDHVAQSFTRNQQPITFPGMLVGTPALAPDGHSLAYGTESGLAFRDLTTGVTRYVKEPRFIFDMRWSALGDAVLAATDEGPEIFRPAGGEPRLFPLEGEDCAAAWMSHGAEILWRCRGDASFTIITLATGAMRSLTTSLPVGETVVDFDVSASAITILTTTAEESALYVAKLDGTQARKLANVGDSNTVRWNAAGTRIYYTRAASSGFEIVFRDVTTTTASSPVVVLQQPQSEMTTYGSFTVSRDERSIIFLVRHPKQDVQLVKPGATAAEQLTVDTQPKAALALAPDASTIAFAAGTELEKRFFQMPLAGGPPTELPLPSADYRSSAFSPAGDELAFTRVTKTGPELSLLRLSDGQTRTLDVPPFDPFRFAWLPTGSIVLLAKGGRNLIVVDPATGTHHPQWAVPQSKELWSPTPSPDGMHVAATVAIENEPPALVVIDNTGQSRIISPTSSAVPLGWSTDLEWIYASEPARDDLRMRIIAISTHGDGRSRALLTGVHEGWPPLVTGNGTVLWLSLVDGTDLWLATADPHGTLPASPTMPPAAPRPQTYPAPRNLSLLGVTGGAPDGWRTSGTPKQAQITSSCGRPGTCVTLEGASNAAVFQSVDATPYRGRRIRVSADLRVEGGRCTLAVDSGVLEHSTVPSGRVHVAAQAWARREMTADIAADASFIQLAAIAHGSGQCWVANFAIDADAQGASK